MEKRLFGKTGFEVSVLGFGAAPAAFLQTEPQQAGKMLNDLLNSGMNVVDTAASYPGSEEFLGNAISHRRGEFVLISKCGTKQPGLEGQDWSRDLIRQSVDRSLRLLKTDVIDVMLLHSCDLATLQKGEAIAALVEARQAGKIRFAGYSGDNDAAAWAADHPEFAAIETSVNITDQINIDMVLPRTRANNLGVIAKRPIANAAWKEIEQQEGMYRSYARVYTERLRQMKLTPAELGFGGAPAEVWPEIALRFTLSQEGVHTAIIGTTKPQNAQQNRDIAAKGPLPPRVVEQIRQAFRAADPNGGWRGQT
jgi:aryl-alcohol dehydrogenase-like predicted oxidoreductase